MSPADKHVTVVYTATHACSSAPTTNYSCLLCNVTQLISSWRISTRNVRSRPGSMKWALLFLGTSFLWWGFQNFIRICIYTLLFTLYKLHLLTHFRQTWHTNAFLQKSGVRWPNESINIYPIFGPLKCRVLAPERAILAKIPLHSSIMTQ